MNKNLSSSVRLYEEFLKLQNIKEWEKIVLISIPQYVREHATIVDAYQTALSNLGADFYTMIIPPKTKGIRLAKPGTDFIFDSLKGANFVLTLGTYIFYGTDRGYELLKSGIRSLNDSIDEHELRRLWPTENIIKRTFEGAKMMEAAKTIKITSKSGTNLTVDKTGKKAHCQCSLAHEPGRWDNAGYGRVDSGPPYAFAEGTVVADIGDYSDEFGIISSPMKFTVKDGYVVDIEGGAEAKMLKTWLDHWEDPQCYRVSHIGWGTNDGGIWAGIEATDRDRYNYWGSVTFAIGSCTMRTESRYSGFPAKIDAAIHNDIVLLNHNLWLDDVQIIKEGKIIHPKCK